MMPNLLAVTLASFVVLMTILSDPVRASAQTGTQAPTTPGGAAPAGPPGAPPGPGQPGPLGQPQEAVRPTPAMTGAQIFDFVGFSFGDTAAFVPGYYVLPSFSVSETYDDNIFLTDSDRRDDFITRFTPGIRLGYVSAPLTALGSYAFDAEVYAKDSSLNNVGDRQRGELEFRYLPNPLLVFSVDAGFARTNDAVDINREGSLLRRRGATPSSVPVAEIQRGREQHTSFTLSPRVTYQLTPLWAVEGGYAFGLTDTDTTSAATSHTISLSASRVITERDTASVGYGFSIFDTEGSDTETSHSVTVGWTRRFSELLTAGGRIGPRFSDDGDVGIDAGANLTYRLGRLTDFSLVYTRSQALVAGRSGSSTADAASAVISTRPLEFLLVSAGPTYTRVSGDRGTGDTSIYGLDAGARYQLTRWLSAAATYRFSYHEGFGADIFHNTVTISLSVSQVIRVY